MPRKGTRFTKGDFIEATHKTVPGTVIRGTALHTRDSLGWAYFSVLIQGTGQSIELNLNQWDTTLLFEADLARAMNPDGDWTGDK